MRRTREPSLSLVALLLIALLTPFFLRNNISAETPPLIISEVKIRNDTDGLDEFIELYNPTNAPVLLNDYVIGYVNSPTPTADQTVAMSIVGDGMLESGEHVLLAKNELDLNFVNAKKSPFSSLSDNGGTIRLMNLDEEIIDEFAWTSVSGSAVPPIQYLCTASNASCNVNKSQSFERSKDTEENYVITSPAWMLGAPSPQSSALLPAPTAEPEPDSEPISEPSTGETPETETSTPAAEYDTAEPQITELFPNPAPPASDSTDEYIEIYNPNDQPLSLSGYRLESGSTFSYKHTFGQTTLGAFEYKAFLVSETGTILSNSGGQARLLASNGTIVSLTNVYDSADEGHAWAHINGLWQWTTTPTPHAMNVLTAPPLKVASKATTTKKPAKKSTKAAVKKKAAAKTKKPAAAAAERQIYEDPSQTTTELHPGILAGVGVLTLVYAAYEYRHDVTNRLQQLRRNREIRQTTRT